MRPSVILALASAMAAVCNASALAGTPPVAPAYALTDQLSIPDGLYDYVSFDPLHRRLYVSRTGGVTAVDVDSKAVTTLLPDAKRTHEILALNGGATLLVTDSETNTAHMVEAMGGKPLAEIATDSKPNGAVFDAATGLALVMNSGAGTATFIDPAKREVVGTAAIGGWLQFPAVDGAGKAFVNIEDQNTIAVLDIKKRAVIDRYVLNGCDSPGGLAYAPEAGVLIASCGNNVAKVIRASDGADIATLAIAGEPDAVIYDNRRKLAFIPCGREGVLEVIAVRGPTDVSVVQTVKTQAGARTGAVDEETGRIYLPTAQNIDPTNARPAAQPGAFTLLVVSPN